MYDNLVSIDSTGELSLEDLEVISGGGWGKAVDVLIKVGGAIDAVEKIYKAGKKIKEKADEVISGLIC